MLFMIETMLMKLMIILSVLSQHYFECCFFRNVQPKKFSSKPWMTKQLINACKKKKSLYKKKICNGSNYNEFMYEKY